MIRTVLQEEGKLQGQDIEERELHCYNTTISLYISPLFKYNAELVTQ